MVMGPTPPGTGVMAAAFSISARKFHIADNFAFAIFARHAVNADIDHDGAFFDPIAFDEFRLANGGDQNIRAATFFW